MHRKRRRSKSATSSPVLIWCDGRVGTKVMGKTLVLVGLGIAALGPLVMAGVPLGRRPGGFAVRRGNFSFYFLLATSIVLSVIL